MTAKPLPCAHCGGEAELRQFGNEHTKRRGFTIKCGGCRIELTNAVIRQSLEWCREQTIEAWNRRALPSDSAAPSGELVALREFYVAVEHQLDWLNGNDMVADYAEAFPVEFKRQCDAMDSIRKVKSGVLDGGGVANGSSSLAGKSADVRDVALPSLTSSQLRKLADEMDERERPVMIAAEKEWSLPVREMAARGWIFGFDETNPESVRDALFAFWGVSSYKEAREIHPAFALLGVAVVESPALSTDEDRSLLAVAKQWRDAERIHGGVTLGLLEGDKGAASDAEARTLRSLRILVDDLTGVTAKMEAAMAAGALEQGKD